MTTPIINAGEIDSLITRLTAQKRQLTRLLRLKQDVTALRQAVFDQPDARQIKVIAQACSEAMRVSQEELLSRRGDQRVCDARHVVFYLARRLTSHSLASIGALCGDKNHGTVLHGVKRMGELMDTEPKLREKVAAIEAACRLKLNGAAKPDKDEP